MPVCSGLLVSGRIVASNQHPGVPSNSAVISSLVLSSNQSSGLKSINVTALAYINHQQVFDYVILTMLKA